MKAAMTGISLLLVVAVWIGPLAAKTQTRDDTAELLNQINYLNTTIKRLQDRIRSLEAAKAQAERERDAARKERDEAQKIAKASPMGQAQQTIENQAKQIKALDLEVRSLRPIVDQLRAENARLKGLTGQTGQTSQPASQPASQPK